MAKLYLQKIINKEINTETNEAWKLEDVPMLWRVEVEEILLEANNEITEE